MASITTCLKQITQKNSLPLPILAFNNDTISVIHTPQPLTPHHTSKEHSNRHLATATNIEPYLKGLVPVHALVYGLFTIYNNLNLFHYVFCSRSNFTVQVEADKQIYKRFVNMSNKTKTLPPHTRVGIITTTTPVVYYQTSISGDLYHQ